MQYADFCLPWMGFSASCYTAVDQSMTSSWQIAHPPQKRGSNARTLFNLFFSFLLHGTQLATTCPIPPQWQLIKGRTIYIPVDHTNLSFSSFIYIDFPGNFLNSLQGLHLSSSRRPCASQYHSFIARIVKNCEGSEILSYL